MPSNKPNNSKYDPKTPAKTQSNNPSTSQSPQRDTCSETDYAELQRKLQGEVARAVELWRKGMVQGTLESQNERIESFIKQLQQEDISGPPNRDKTSNDIGAQLRRENDQLRQELEEMRKLDVNDVTVERLQELQHDNKNLRNTISKLQEEVQEKNAIHHRKIRDQQDVIRKSQMSTVSGESAVNRLKAENQSLKAKVAEVTKASEEEETGETKTFNSQVRPKIDLSEKVSKAEHRLQIACLELNLKRKHPKRIPAHSIKSLEDIACVWNEHVNLLRILQRKQNDLNILKDRLEMFVSNIEILKDENSELSSRLGKVRDEMRAFRENPMNPTEQVVKNVNLLLHMERIDNSLAEKAVELDKNEMDLKREQLRVREILIRVEELRRENRHFTRRLQKDALKRDYQSRAVLSGVGREDDSTSSSCSSSKDENSRALDLRETRMKTPSAMISTALQCILKADTVLIMAGGVSIRVSLRSKALENSDDSPLLNMDPGYGTALEEGEGTCVESGLEDNDQPDHPQMIECRPESDGADNQPISSGCTDVQVQPDPCHLRVQPNPCHLMVQPERQCNPHQSTDLQEELCSHPQEENNCHTENNSI